MCKEAVWNPSQKAALHDNYPCFQLDSSLGSDDHPLDHLKVALASRVSLALLSRSLLPAAAATLATRLTDLYRRRRRRVFRGRCRVPSSLDSLETCDAGSNGGILGEQGAFAGPKLKDGVKLVDGIRLV